MAYQWIDLESFPRRKHFAYFSTLAYPYVGTTANVDITDTLRVIKGEKLPFFLTVCYCVARAANSVPELRQRIRDGRIIIFDHCRTSHTVALEDGTYCYCTLDGSLPFDKYLSVGKAAQERARQRRSLEEEAEEPEELLFISTTPWLTYTALVQPVPIPADSNPRITWGKYTTEGRRTVMPATLLVNHALVDGARMGQFFAMLAREMKRFVDERACARQ